MATHEEISGIFRRVKWRSKDGTDYIIGFLEDGTTVKGNAEEGELCEGTAYRFFGRWAESNNRQFPEPSFQFVCFVKDLPHSREGIVQYLLRELKGHKTGIGHATAHALYDHYKADAVRTIRMEPAKVASELNLDLEKTRHAAAILEEDKKCEDSKIELTDLFAGKGFPGSAIKACIQKWGPKAPAMIRRDAFQLLTNRIPGAGFSRCDNLYLSLGGDPSKLKRQSLCAWNGLRENGAGHTWHPVEVGIAAIKAKVGGVNIQPIKALRLARRSKLISVHRENGNTWLGDAKKTKAEQDVARIVARFMAKPAKWPKVQSSAATPHQREQLQFATPPHSRISILAGSAGTGKTFTAASLIEAIIAAHSAGSIAIVTPTGKAAVRITEAMVGYGIQDIRGQTIHRILEPNDPERGHGEGEWGFRFNEQSKLPCQWYIGDEWSMVDTSTFASFLRAVPPDAHILLIGDPFQLTPVGHGAPLRDMMAAGVPYGLLSEIHRNSGLIVEACNAIKDGKQFRTCQAFDTDKGDNLKLINVESSAAVVDHLRLMIQAMREAGKRDLFEDFQVLTPLNEKSDLARKKLNPILQDLINPNGKRAEGNKYRVRDKVICLDNGKYPDAAFPKVKHGVSNGEQGRVTEVSKDATFVEFPDLGDGPRVVRFPVKGELANSIDLGYAITIHKSQGSQWLVVVTIVDEAASRMGSRELIYTGFSRGKERQIVFGRMSTILRQIKRIELHNRKTFLKEKIAEELLVQSAAREILENHIREDASHVRAESIQAATF